MDGKTLGDSFIKQIKNSNWGESNEKDSNKKNVVYEGILKEPASLSLDKIMFESGKDSIECQYYISEAWKVNGPFLLNFLKSKRKIRFSDSSVFVSKVQSDSYKKTVVKFLPSVAALLIIEPATNRSDVEFLTSASYLFKDLFNAENLCIIIQILEIYPSVGDRLEISIRDSSNSKSTLVLWASQILLVSLLKKVYLFCIIDSLRMIFYCFTIHILI